jgi:IS30 family transposase
VGHWGNDLIISRRSPVALNTLVRRKSRLTVITRVKIHLSVAETLKPTKAGDNMSEAEAFTFYLDLVSTRSSIFVY